MVGGGAGSGGQEERGRGQAVGGTAGGARQPTARLDASAGRPAASGGTAEARAKQSSQPASPAARRALSAAPRYSRGGRPSTGNARPAGGSSAASARAAVASAEIDMPFQAATTCGGWREGRSVLSAAGARLTGGGLGGGRQQGPPSCTQAAGGRALLSRCGRGRWARALNRVSRQRASSAAASPSPTPACLAVSASVCATGGVEGGAGAAVRRAGRRGAQPAFKRAPGPSSPPPAAAATARLPLDEHVQPGELAMRVAARRQRAVAARAHAVVSAECRRVGACGAGKGAGAGCGAVVLRWQAGALQERCWPWHPQAPRACCSGAGSRRTQRSAAPRAAPAGQARSSSPNSRPHPAAWPTQQLLDLAAAPHIEPALRAVAGGGSREGAGWQGNGRVQQLGAPCWKVRQQVPSPCMPLHTATPRLASFLVPAPGSSESASSAA